LDEHRVILDALHAGDPELVRAAVTLHIGGVESWLRQAD
jgi:GntR family transcriptional repressor for pyruvate dehydrogenase complex